MRHLALAGLALGVLIGFAVSFSPPAEATRNSSGTYSLPSGNPVSTGTTITSSWANTTLNDLATEITNSLDRQGRGAMQAPLQLDSGTSNLPGLTFSGDTDTGLYRSTANTMHAVAGATAVQEWTSTGTEVTGTLDVSGAVTLSDDLAVTGDASFDTDTLVVDATNGFVGVGHATPDVPLHVEASGANYGGVPFAEALAYFKQTNTTGNASVVIDSPANKSSSLYFSQDGTARWTIRAGDTVDELRIQEWESGTATTRVAIKASGAIDMSSATNPSSTTAFSETLTPKNLIKAWGTLEWTGASTVVVRDGFNIASAADNGSTDTLVTVTLASAMANTYFAVFVNGPLDTTCVGGPGSTTTILITCTDLIANPVTRWNSGTGDYLSFVVLGTQ